MANIIRIDRANNNIELDKLTASRLLALDSGNVLKNTDLNSWVTGTSNQITVTDDTDGTITLSLPQSIHTAATPTFAGLLVNANATTPQTATSGTVLHVAQANTAVLRILADAYANAPTVTFRRADGTAASPSALQLDEQMGELSFHGYGASEYSASGRAHVRCSAAENWTNAAQGTYLSFTTTPVTTITPIERMRIVASGRVCIGTIVDPDTTLHINGSHTATKGMLFLTSSDHAFMGLQSAADSYTGIIFNEGSGGTRWQLVNDYADDCMKFKARLNADVFRWSIDQNGNVEQIAGNLTLTAGDIILTAGGDIQLATTTGTKIGTATNQLLSFYGATPVDQPATVADPSGGLVVDAEARTAIIAVIDRLQELGLIA